jgi:hypothetical protein
MAKPEHRVRTLEGRTSRSEEPRLDSEQAWVITDPVGDIREISADAARVLNLSPRGARGRNLATFFVDNRPRLMAELLRAAEGLIIERQATLQPRDRKPMHVHLDVSAIPTARGERVYLRWLISPAA